MTYAFQDFKEMMVIILNVDNLDPSLLQEYLIDWYSMYQDQKTYDHPLPWAKENFQDVRPATHDFWLDARGIKLYELSEVVRKYI